LVYFALFTGAQGKLVQSGRVGRLLLFYAYGINYPQKKNIRAADALG